MDGRKGGKTAPVVSQASALVSLKFLPKVSGDANPETESRLQPSESQANLPHTGNLLSPL